MIALGYTRVGADIGHVNFMVFVPFLPVLLPNTNAVSGEIWALEL